MKTGKMIKYLKRIDRTLLEMHTGMLLYGLICQTVGAFFVKDQLRFASSLWFGVLFAVTASIHMARTLDRALADSASASKLITRGYVFRYLMVIVILAIVSVTNVMDTLIVFLGYMSLKLTAYLQPFTHRFYNMLFHETDPVPQALPEEEDREPEEAS
ncbi:MAG: ATP synthase subunit I [Firmicutes bacterium]|nr:ATP synthase subunit I [Bacillota bacterium]